MRLILDHQPPLLELRAERVADELRADQVIDIPLPFVGWIAARAVQAHKTSARFHPGFEGGALFRRQHIAAGAVPDDSLELGELLRIKNGGILGGEARPTLILGDFFERGVGGCNLVAVTKAVGFGENENCRLFEFRQLWSVFVIGDANVKKHPPRIAGPNRPQSGDGKERKNREKDIDSPFQYARHWLLLNSGACRLNNIARHQRRLAVQQLVGDDRIVHFGCALSHAFRPCIAHIAVDAG